MIICTSCFTRNEENALYCAECGKELNLPECAKHEFTHGVMRYVPDAQNEEDETPLYLTREAADAIRQDADASSGPATGKAAVPAAPVAQGIPAPVSIPPAVAVPAGKAPAAKRARKKNSHLPAIIIMSVIGILLILIIFGIVILLGG